MRILKVNKMYDEANIKDMNDLELDVWWIFNFWWNFYVYLILY